MDAIGIPYSYIPDMQYCCGLGTRGGRGDADWLQESAERLIDKTTEFKVETLVCWCATCSCNLKYRFGKFVDKLPFESLTFGKYLKQNIDMLSFPAAKPCTLTLHEPCKTAYMNIDLEEIRDVLRAIPGTTLVEMEHHHENSICCGCRAVNSMPEVGNTLTDKRLGEALNTGADKLLDVCHNCHWIFRRYQDSIGRCDVNVENYSTYIVSAMGHEREDSMK